MSGPANASEAARLDELAAVTSEYAGYSRTVFGVGDALIGAWLISAAWVRTISARGGELLLFVAPVASIAIVAAARAYYQRRGEVVEQRAAPPWVRGLILLCLYLWSVVAAWQQSKTPLEQAGGAVVLVAIAALVATPMLALRCTRGLRDAGTAMVLVMLAALTRANRGAPSEDLFVWGGALFGGALVVVGIWGHIQYRRMERRLAAFRERA
jgi:hypothetical protein